MTARVERDTEPWLVVLDVDGTVLRNDATASDTVIEQLRRLDATGHHVMLATGRSPSTTLPVVEYLGITAQFLVCSNGAVVLQRDVAADRGYQTAWVECFDPSATLHRISSHLDNVRYAVEDDQGNVRYSESFPNVTMADSAERVDFEQLLQRPATRIVAVSPGHDMGDFRAAIERMDLRQVSYFVGGTAWMDIAGEGVSKGSAMERVRHELGIPRQRVMAVADGRNDIELLAWAAAGGRGVAMGHAPAEVLAVAGEVTGTIDEDGLAHVLATL